MGKPCWVLVYSGLLVTSFYRWDFWSAWRDGRHVRASPWRPILSLVVVFNSAAYELWGLIYFQNFVYISLWNSVCNNNCCWILCCKSCGLLYSLGSPSSEVCWFDRKYSVFIGILPDRLSDNPDRLSDYSVWSAWVPFHLYGWWLAHLGRINSGGSATKSQKKI